MLETGIRVFYVTHMFDSGARALPREDGCRALFPRAERLADGPADVSTLNGIAEPSHGFLPRSNAVLQHLDDRIGSRSRFSALFVFSDLAGLIGNFFWPAASAPEWSRIQVARLQSQIPVAARLQVLRAPVSDSRRGCSCVSLRVKDEISTYPAGLQSAPP